MDEFKELLEAMRQEEEELQFSVFTNETAYELGKLLVDTALKENKSVTVDISRNGQQLFHCALNGTSADNDEWVKRKSRVVNRFGHSSFYLGTYYKSRGTTLNEKALLDPAEYAAHGGSFPIIIKNVGVVGTITVSGLPQEEDHRMVVTAIRAFLANS